MYGSADLDPAVKYYDLAFAAGATAILLGLPRRRMHSVRRSLIFAAERAGSVLKWPA